MRQALILLVSLAVCVGLLSISCAKASPVAPEGAILRISAAPTIISLGESSTITVTASRTTGSALVPGTEIRFSTSLGDIEEVAPTDADGVAQAILTATQDFGMATVSAWSGASETVSVEVTMGRPAASVTLQVIPTVIPDTGGEAELLALVRDGNGDPLDGAVANFTSTMGTLASGGSFVTSDSRGEVRDMLTVTESELLALPGVTFDVDVSVSAGGNGVVTARFTIRVFSGEPVADFTVIKTVDDPANGICKATFNNNSTGLEPMQFSWNFVNGLPGSSTQKNPGEVSFLACSQGSIYTVNLTVTNTAGTHSLQSLVTFDGSGI